MVLVLQMRELVEDNMLHEMRREHEQPPTQADSAVRCAASPATSLCSNKDIGRAQSRSLGESLNQRRQYPAGLGRIPRRDELRDNNVPLSVD